MLITRMPVIKPTLIQNNVPAFALFAMFFIVIPLAGSLLAERKDGTYTASEPCLLPILLILLGKDSRLCDYLFASVVIDDCGGYVFLARWIYGIPALSLGQSIMWH